MRAFDIASSAPWVVLPETLQTILQIASRENEAPEAVAAKLGRKLDNTRTVQNRDGVAVIPITGPIFRYANLFTEISGAVSVGILARDFSEALANPKIRGIVLEIDSPGGEATGINELGKMIAAGARQKPVIAYGGGMVASGAYWLASAAGEIVVDETAMLGSIGVVITARKRDGSDGTVEIVSSQSPNKRVDPAKESGRAEIQRLVDDLAQVFVETIARNRGVSAEKVLEDFGKGGLLVAKSAIAAGMADRVGSLEGVIAELQQRAAGSRTGLRTAVNPKQGVTSMSDMTNPAAENTASTGQAAAPEPAPPQAPPTSTPSVDPEAIQAAAAKAAAEAVKAERARAAAILDSEEAKGREALARVLAYDTDLPVDVAKKALAAAAKATTNPLAEAMEGVPNPAVGAAKDASASADGDLDKMIDRLFAGAKKGGE